MPKGDRASVDVQVCYLFISAEPDAPLFRSLIWNLILTCLLSSRRLRVAGKIIVWVTMYKI